MAASRTFYLFSEVNGVVVRDGKPVAGAEVERSYVWHWKDQTASETVTTDADGRFAFPEVTRSSFLASLMPHQPLIEQTITIRHGGQTYKAWSHAKYNYDRNGELSGKSLKLTCDLDAEEQFTLTDSAAKRGYRGICRIDAP